MMIDIEKRVREKYEQTVVTEFPRKNLLIEVTNICNNKCIFCTNRKMTRAKGYIDYDLAIRILKECYDLGTREVGFYATGEPLLYPKLKELISYAKMLGYDYVYLTTNGLLATKPKIMELLEAGLDSIKFSINAINRLDYKFVHGVDAYDIVLQNLKDCKELQEIYRNKLFVSCITTRYTPYTQDDVDKVLGKYCDRVVLQPVKNQGGLLPKIVECLVEEDKVGQYTSSFAIPCSYVFNAVTISCEGYMTACCMDFQNYLAYADLNNCSVLEGWNNQVITAVRNAQRCGEVGNSLCKACVYGKQDIIEPISKNLATLIDNKFLSEDNDMIDRISTIKKSKKGE